MPEYAGFSTALISQYDAATIPEDHVRVVTTPSLRSLHLDNLTRNSDSPRLSEQHPDKTVEDLQHKTDTTVVEAYVPVYQSSRFWICYECPLPDDGGEEGGGNDVKYYYFKLFVSGKCVLSWGVGEEERWRGKTMFGFFDGGRDFEGRRTLEKRGLFFRTAGGVKITDGFEVRIFRAKARRSESVRYQGLNEVVGRGCSLDFTSIGNMQRGEQRRYYTYALLDAKDEPYFTFRYRFEVDDDGTPRIESTFLSTDTDDTTTSIATDVPESEDAQAEQTESSLWSGAEQNTPQDHPITVIAQDEKTETIRRLSFPPRNQLFPSAKRREPSSPTKYYHQASASDDDLVRHRVEYSSLTTFSRRTTTTGLRKPEWTAVRTASPLMEEQGMKETVPAPAHRKSASSGSSGLLRSVVASALRRKEERPK